MLIKNEKGMAIFEMIPIIVVIMILLNFSLGFFGAIHTGIMQSISARNYTFETFRHRATLNYFHPLSEDNAFTYSKVKMRLHGIISPKRKGSSKTFVATSRLIDHFDFRPERMAGEGTNATSDHVNKVQELNDDRRNEEISVNPIWIKTFYGICLNANCKP